MRVKDLIEILETFDPELEIKIGYSEESAGYVESSFEKTDVKLMPAYWDKPISVHIDVSEEE